MVICLSGFFGHRLYEHHEAMKTATQFKHQLENKKFSTLLKNAKVSDKNVTLNTNNIFLYMGTSNVKISGLSLHRTKTGYEMIYAMKMQTKIGELKFSNIKGRLIKDGHQWRIKDPERFLLPRVNLGRDVLLAEVQYAKRGSISDAKGWLARDVTKKYVGVSPQKLGNSKLMPTYIRRIANYYKVDLYGLQQRLNQFLVVDSDSFLPLTVYKGNVPNIPGLITKDVTRRAYAKDKRHQSVGTVSMISDAEIERHHWRNPQDRLGRTGLERKYNDQLAGIDGGRFIFRHPNGSQTAIYHRPVNGKNIRLSK